MSSYVGITTDSIIIKFYLLNCSSSHRFCLLKQNRDLRIVFSLLQKCDSSHIILQKNLSFV
ncbi:hypothetical protein LEP1GSC041_2749 [Leptospira noguchii str. 2006001870]|nr:hypothetical protein LEP1GSC041_2749 [Leptospira noguchii str. 2006001870]